MKYAFCAAALMFISGCSTVEQNQEYSSRVGRESYWQKLQLRCSNYGFTAGTTAFANCVMQLNQADRNEDAALIGAILRSRSAPVPANTAPAYQVPNAPAVTSTCRNDGLGNIRCSTR